MYRVVWKESAVNELTLAWTLADSQLRARITATTNELDKLLSKEPASIGESREPGTRLVILSPLTATFSVNVRLLSVWVASVHVYGRKK